MLIGAQAPPVIPAKAGIQEAEVGVPALDPRFRGCNPIPHIAPSRPFLVVPAKAGTQEFQSLAPGSPLARGRRIVCPQDFLTTSFAGRRHVSVILGAFSVRYSVYSGEIDEMARSSRGRTEAFNQ